jgi:hypothetical protein
MADKLPFFAAESGTWKTTSPNPHIDLSGTALTFGTYPTQTFAAAAADATLDFATTNTCTIVAWVDASNWRRYEGAVWTDAAPDTLGLSAATLMGAAGTISADAAVSVVASLPIDVAPTQCVTFTKTGTLATGTGTARFYFNATRTLTAVRIGVGTAPTGANLIVDVNKGGTTIFTTQSNRPEIAASGFTDESGTVEVTSMAAGDYLTVDIDQIGSTIAGADLVVNIYYT